MIGISMVRTGSWKSTRTLFSTPLWRKLSPKARILVALLAFGALMLAFPARQAALQEWHKPPEVTAIEKPLSDFLYNLYPRSRIEVVDTDPLRVVGTVNCSPEQRTELEGLLRELCPIEPDRGGSLVLVTGRVPYQMDARTQLILVALLALAPALLALQQAVCWLLQMAVPCLRFTPAVVLSGVLCLGWPLWTLVPSLLLFWVLLPRPRKLAAIANGPEEAAIWLMSRPPDYSAQCFQRLGPDAVHQITLAISKLPPIADDRRAQVQATFAVSVERTRQRLGVKKASAAVDPDLAARTLTEWYLPAQPPARPKAARTIPLTHAKTRRRSRRRIYSCQLCDEVFLDEASLNNHQCGQAERPPSPAGVTNTVSWILIAVGLILAPLLARPGRSISWLTLPQAQMRVQDQRVLEQLTHLTNLDSLVVIEGQHLSLVGVRGIDPAELQPLAESGVKFIRLAPSLRTSGLLHLAIGASFFAWVVFLRWRNKPVVTAPVPAAAPPQPVEAPQSLPSLMEVDGLGLHLGRNLLCLVEPARGKLQERLTTLRRHMVLELGLVMPGVRFRDNLSLPAHEYTILVRDCVVAQGTVQPDKFLAIGPLEKLGSLPGEVVNDPTYGMTGKWIAPHYRGDAERLGCMIFDPVSVVATHLTEIVREHAAELLGLAEVCRLLQYDKLRPLADEVAAQGADPILIWKVLRQLLREGVSIRDLAAILESIAEHVHLTRESGWLVEFVRASLARPISQKLANASGTLNVMTLEPELETLLEACLSEETLDWEKGPSLIEAIGVQVKVMQERGLCPTLLTSPPLRPKISRLLQRSFPGLQVISWNEIAPKFNVNSVAVCSALDVA